MRLIRDLIIHLRLHYQLLLAPIFLWGYFLAGGQPDRDFWLAFLAFHVFLYGGITAFNSYYDRDEGPVGGLVKPPPVSQALLPFSLAVQTLGAILAAFVNINFLLIYLLIFSMGIAYSQPRTRLKGRPLAGLAVVGLGQGVLASLGGWICAKPYLATVDSTSWLGIMAVTLITTGFYPLTQIYQIDEDRARGDWTFAVWAGPRGTFAFALVVQGVAAILLVGIIGRLLGWVDAFVVALFYGALLVAVSHWAYTFDGAHILANYRRVMGINTLTSFGFMGFILLHMFGIW
jgi:1,4-dihydroxy-2-naphthoate octaprenyltransferase